MLGYLGAPGEQLQGSRGILLLHRHPAGVQEASEISLTREDTNTHLTLKIMKSVVVENCTAMAEAGEAESNGHQFFQHPASRNLTLHQHARAGGVTGSFMASGAGASPMEALTENSQAGAHTDREEKLVIGAEQDFKGWIL